MQDFEKLGAFYLGRTYDTVRKEPGNDLLLYDSRDLVTHAVVVGMTGSGKTGLCVGLLEEAAIDGVPAIIIDPKGDLGNLLLQFPDLRPEDFQPWINDEDAQREGVSPADYAAKQAELWKTGLAKWGQDGERIRRLKNSADFAIYTPGSSAGLPVSILKSFDPPAPAILEDREAFRDRIGVTATAVLSLLGIDAEPMKSREHILVSGILDHAWQNGQSLDLAALIRLIQNPPMERVGVLDLEAFYPSKDRFELAMALNNLLASPGFEAWLEGEPLDIDRLLRTPEGKPRHSVLSIAHLNDTERMFFVSLLLNEVLSWTRAQSGTTSLRAIVYMDEIFGYFPPTANPPSKRPLLTLLKQARAFGVGVVLATQNPVDLDYKGLANAGTWFIGRLQTERDKARLIDGLESASGESGAKVDRARIDAMLSSLGKRVFLMNNVHESAPVTFETRWALSYLRGPLTRAQVKQLTSARRPAAAAAPASAPARGAQPRNTAGASHPVLPPDIPQAWVPLRGAADGIVYQPMLLGAAQIRFTDAKAKIDFLKDAVFLTPVNDDALPVQWEECTEADLDPSSLEQNGAEGPRYGTLPAAAAKPKQYAQWQKDLVTWIYGHQQLVVYRSPSTKLASSPGETEGEFRARIDQKAREERDAAIDKLRAKYAPKAQTLQDRLMRAQQAVEREKEQAQQANLSTMLSAGATVLGALFGSRKVLSKGNIGALGTAVRGMGRARKESSDIERAGETVESIQQQIRALEEELKTQTDAIQARIDAAAEAFETVEIKPKKTNISVRLFTLAWVPYRGSEPAW